MRQALGTVQISSVNGEIMSKAHQDAVHQNQET